MTQSPAFEAARESAMRRIALGSWLVAPVAPLTAWAVGNDPLPVLLIAAVFAGLGSVGARLGGPTGRIAAGLALIGQAVAVTAALAGHPWQLDSHMLYFAFLAMAMSMSDRRVILVASATVAAHHLAMSLASAGPRLSLEPRSS